MIKVIKLIKYQSCFKSDTVGRIAQFFLYHINLKDKNALLTEANYILAEETLSEWTDIDNELYLINLDNNFVGFLHIGYRGENVAWIEDIFVDENMRRKGIATEAIKIAEYIFREKAGYTAICFDVAPRNNSALYLYHKLGYDSLSILTIRKELYGNKNDKIETIFGLEFKY